EEWVVHAFGRKMFECYFKCYTEKVWGIDCSRISADWASQRIGGLSLRVALLNALGLKRNNTPKTLIESFCYPRHGIGEISLRMAERIEAKNQILRRARVRKLLHDGTRITALLWEGEDGELRRHEGTHYLSSIPITEVVRGFDPPAPPEILAAAQRLKFRSLVLVALFFDVPQVTESSWIYFPDPQIGFGRIHEPNNWSRDLIPEGRSCLVFEYFCTEGDEVWSLDDAALVERTLGDLSRLDFHPRLSERVLDRCVVRLRHAYPIYEIGFKVPLGRIMRYVRTFSNLTLMGRYGTYKYINMDHSIEMGMKAAENLLGRRHDILGVDRDSAYLEGPPLDSAA
ncbi:MAG: FAD-dependent oxidoreductase, partial [Deltaproteobacteria bacterium]